MFDAGLLDTLVELASFGTSGISIFAIFWIGWLLYRRPASRSLDEHKTLRYFMATCLVIAVISATTGIANATFDANYITELESTNQTLSQDLNAKSEEIFQLERQVSGLEAAVAELQPPIKILAHPSTNVKPNGAVCLTLTWVRSLDSSNVLYIWTADAGIFEPPGMTPSTQAKWIAPESSTATTIKINVVAIDAHTQELIGEGEATNIGVVGVSVAGLPEDTSVNCS